MCKIVRDAMIDKVFKEGAIEKALVTIEIENSVILIEIKANIRKLYTNSYPDVTIPKKVLLYTDIDEFINAIKRKRFHMLFVGGKVSCTAKYNALPFNKFNKFIEIIKYAKISENIVVNIGKTLYIYYKEDNK